MAKRKIGSKAPLLTLGTIAATGIVLNGCGEPEAVDTVYNTPTECAQSGVDLQICEAEYQQALQSHLQNAPRFDGQAACEAEYGEGRCLSSESVGQQAEGGGGSFFLPFMTGYLVSSAIGNLGSYAAYRNYRGTPSYSYSNPIYTNRAGQTVTSATQGGQRVSRPVNVNTRTVSRSGFGGRSSSRGFFGG